MYLRTGWVVQGVAGVVRLGAGGGARPQSRSQQPRMQRMEYSVSGGAPRQHPSSTALPHQASATPFPKVVKVI